MTGATPDLAAPTRGGDAGRVLLLAFGAIVTLLGAAFLAAGGAMLWVDGTQRDEAGYLNSTTEQLLTRSYALTTDPLEVHIGSARGWLVDEDVLGSIRLQAESADPDVGVFVGIARTSEVERYLAGVELDRLDDLELDPFRPTYVRQSGGAPRGAPTEETFWTASASGAGRQTLTWAPESGRWTVVAMNADASRAVDVRVRAGAQLGLLDWLGAIVLGAGVLVLAGGVAMIVVGARRSGTPAGG